MGSTVKIKRSKRDKRKYVDKWLKEYGLSRSTIQSQAMLDGMGTLSDNDYYSMAVGYRKEARDG